MAAAPYWGLYCSVREAIKEAAAAAAPVPEGSSKHNDEATPSRPELELHLERLVQETHHSSVAAQERPDISRHTRQDSGHEQEAASIGETEDAVEAGEDECLGVLAEAFADDLDDLRKDEHFRGSARDVAAMADMMR